MNPLEKALRQLAGELNAETRWALVGGLAISSRLEPRFTRDLDLAVAVESDAEAEHLIRRLTRLGYSPRALVEQEAKDRLATVRLSAPENSGVIVDLLFASSGIEAEIVSEAEPLEIAPGLTLPVAQLWHLLAMKVLSRDDQRRPQDLVDLRNLLAAVSGEDLAKARRALALISQRGFNRKKDLAVELEKLIDTQPE